VVTGVDYVHRDHRRHRHCKETGSSVLGVATKLKDIAVKDSVSVNGICLTVTEAQARGGSLVFSVDFSKETLDRTTMGRLKAGDMVNLERALRADSRIGGHMVSGHVEAVGSCPR